MEKALFLFAAFILLAHSVWLLTRSYGFESWDFLRMYMGGKNALHGASPYEVRSLLYLPTSFPLFELFALVPFQTMQQILLVVNTLIVLVLPYFSWIVLAESGPYSAERVGAYPYAASACIFVAVPSILGIEAGQMQAIATLLILASLHLKFQGRQFLTGLILAAATLKVSMMFPALTQFCDRKSRWVWVGLAAGVAILLVLGTPLYQIPDRFRENLANIAENSKPGGHDDVDFENRTSTDIISIGRWLYCLGMRDRSAMKILEFAILGLMGIGLTGATATGRIGPDASIAAACTLGTFFLYHRIYDAVLLAPALIYCAAGVRHEVGWPRSLFMASTLAILAVMNMVRGLEYRHLSLWSIDAGIAGRFVQIFLLPYAMWCLIGLMAVLCFVQRSNDQGATETYLSPPR
jgi:hypothetical protein